MAEKIRENQFMYSCEEVFATSGPRIRIRFASFDFDESMLKAADAIDRHIQKV